MNCNVGEATEGLKNDYDVDEATEGLENNIGEVSEKLENEQSL